MFCSYINKRKSWEASYLKCTCTPFKFYPNFDQIIKKIIDSLKVKITIVYNFKNELR